MVVAYIKTASVYGRNVDAIISVGSGGDTDFHGTPNVVYIAMTYITNDAF